MIVRVGSLLLILYALGFLLFGVTLGKSAGDDVAATDAIVVITGGEGRIEHAVAMLAQRKGKRLLIAGADPAVTKEDLVRRLQGRRRLMQCCVDLGSESVDTRSIRRSAQLARHRISLARLITSLAHAARAYEFDRSSRQGGDRSDR